MFLVLLLAASYLWPMAARGSHADGTYELPVWFRWEKADLDVIVIPPNHGQVANGNGALNGGDPDELTPFNSYLRAIEDSIADWDEAVTRFAPAWLAAGLTTSVYVAGRDPIPPSALQSPEIVIVSDEWKANILGVAVSTRPCIVDNSKFFLQSFTYEDMFNINAQEYGHCLGLEHVVDNHPEHDSMAGQYVHSPGARGADLHCVSNLDVRGLESVFGSLFGHPGPDVVSMPVSAYTTTCGTPAAPAPDMTATPTSNPSTSPSLTATATATPTPTPTATPTSRPTATPTPRPSDSAPPSAADSPSPGSSPSPSGGGGSSPRPAPSAAGSPEDVGSTAETHEREITLRLVRHLVARGVVRAPGGPRACRANVMVVLEKRSAAGWRSVERRATAVDGSYQMRIRDRDGRYRTRVAGSDDCGSAISRARSHSH